MFPAEIFLSHLIGCYLLAGGAKDEYNHLLGKDFFMLVEKAKEAVCFL